MTLFEEVMQAALVAADDRKTAALRVLRGDAGEMDDGGGRRAEVEPYLTLEEAGRRLGISSWSLRRYGVPSHSFAGRPRFRMSEVEAHLRALEGLTTKGAKGAKGRGHAKARRAGPKWEVESSK